jgi:uncharacterized membrane protein YedE/YeeE
MAHTPRYKLGVYQARKEGPHFALIWVFQGLRIGFVKVTAQIGVVSPAQTAKWYSRLRVESLPTSAQARDGSWAQAHQAAKTVPIPILLGQYLVGSIIVLMFSGGVALEQYATGRASPVLEPDESRYRPRR